MSAIELNGLTKVFPGAEQPSVAGLDLRVDDGEFLCLLGPSGCGKSTTLRMIAGLESPTAGAISVAGRVVDDVTAGTRVEPERRNLGFVFQNYALWPHMTVRDNVAFGPRMRKASRTQVADAVEDALTTLAISQYADRYPSELSGGQQQRVAIARTLAAGARTLLLDEPLSNLDARLRLEMRAEFARLHRETGATMVFVTHDQWEAMTLATRIVVMNQGVIQQSGTPLEIYDRPRNRFTAEFMGSPPINVMESGARGTAAEAVWALARGTGATIGSMAVRPEDVHFAADVDSVPAGSVHFPVTVDSLLPTGGSWIVEATDGAVRTFAVSTAAPRLRAGDRAELYVPFDRLHLFDEQGDRVEHTPS